MRLRVPACLLVFTANLLFSGTSMIKSIDGGRTWIDIDPELPHQSVVDFQIARNGSRLYALAVTQNELGPLGAWLLDRRDFSVLASSDGGQTWEILDPLSVARVRSAKLAVAPSDPQTVYVAYEDTDLNSSSLCGIFPFAWALRRTTDGGRTAVEVRGDIEVLRSINLLGTLWCYTGALAVHPAISTTVFLSLEWVVDYDGIHFGTLSSADGGDNWQAPSNIGITELKAAESDLYTLYSLNKEIYTGKLHLAKSTDGGKEWSRKLADVAAFAISPTDAAVLLASRNDGSLWKSTDGGEIWQHLGNSLPFDRLVFHPAKPSLVLAQASALLNQSLRTDEIFQSEDEGSTWTAVPTGTEGFWFVFHPSDSETIYGISEKRQGPAY